MSSFPPGRGGRGFYPGRGDLPPHPGRGGFDNNVGRGGAGFDNIGGRGRGFGRGGFGGRSSDGFGADGFAGRGRVVGAVGRGGFGRGGGGRFDDRFDDGGRGGGGRMGSSSSMGSYSSLGRGGGGGRFDDSDRGRIGSYSALADSRMSAPPTNSYADMAGPKPEESRGSYSSLADNLEPPPRSFAMMGETSQPPQIQEMKRGRGDYDDGMGYDVPPQQKRGPPPMHWDNDRPNRAPPDMCDRGPSGPMHPAQRDWDRGGGGPDFGDRMPPPSGPTQEDQFGRQRGFGPGRGFGGRSTGGPGRGGPPLSRFNSRDDMMHPDDRQFAQPRREDSSSSMGRRFDEGESNSIKRSPMRPVEPSQSSSTMKSEPPFPVQQRMQSEDMDVSTDTASSNNGREDEPPAPAVDVVPPSPAPIPSPEPAAPSPLAVAMSRMVEMNADMEFAYAKLLMLELEHARVAARLEALEKISDESGQASFD